MRWRWRWVMAGLIIVVGCVVADNLLARSELDSLLNATETSEQALTTFNTATQDILAIVPAPADQAAALEHLGNACVEGLRGVQTAGAAMERLRIAPWHSGLVSARLRYLDHIDAWRVHLGDCAQTPEDVVDPAAGDRIAASFIVAGQAYRSAVPPFVSDAARSRVESIFQVVAPA